MKLTWHHWLIYSASTAALLWLRENWLFQPGHIMPVWIFWPLLVGAIGGAWGIPKIDLRAAMQRIKWKRVVIWAAAITVVCGIGYGSVEW